SRWWRWRKGCRRRRCRKSAAGGRSFRRRSGHRRPDDARLVAQLGRHHLTTWAGVVGRLVEAPADTAADDHEVGSEDPLEVPQVLVDPAPPLLPRELLAVAGAGGRPVLDRLEAAEVEVPELGVGDEDPVGEQGAADAGAESQ